MKLTVIEPFQTGRKPFVKVGDIGQKRLGELIRPEHLHGCRINGEFVDAWPEHVIGVDDDIEVYMKPGEAISIGIALAATSIGVSSATLTTVIGLALSIGIGFAIRALTPKPRIGFSSLGGSRGRREEAFGIAGLTNTIAPGTPKYVVYGTRRVHGHLIASKLHVAPDGKSMAFDVLYFMGDTGGDGYQSISDVRINRTAIADIEGTSVETRLGTDPQSVIPGFEEPSQAYFDGRECTFNTPVVYTTVSSDVRRAQLLFQWPTGLRRVNNSSGGIELGRSDLKIEFKRPADPGWFLAQTLVTSKRTESKLFREAQIDFGTADQWQIRVTEEFDKDLEPLVTAPHAYAQLFNVEEIQAGTFSYPGSALLAVSGIGTEVVQSLQNLECSALIQGKKVKIWNGASFTTAWTNKRAWIVRDILTHPKVGLGHRISEAFHDDDAALAVQTTVWDQIVDGLDGEPQEAMDQCDVVVNERRPGWDWIKDLLAEGRAAYIPSGGKLKLIVDAAKTPNLLYAMPGNIIEGTVKRELGFEEKSINTVRGEFPDDDKDYVTNVVEVQDSAIGSDPIKELSFTYLSKTRESDVIREIQYQLKRRVLIRRRFVWQSPQTAQVSEPLDVDQLSYQTHNHKRGYSGFVGADGTDTLVNLDQLVELAPATTYDLVLRKADNTVETKTVSTGAGKHGKVTVSEAFASPTAKGDLYAIGEQNVAVVPVLIESMKPADDGRWEMTASEYFASVYTQDPLPPRSQRRFFRVPQILPLPLADAQVYEQAVLNPDGSTAMIIVFDVTPGLIKTSGVSVDATASTLTLPTDGSVTTKENYYKDARFTIVDGPAAGEVRTCISQAAVVVPSGLDLTRLGLYGGPEADNLETSGGGGGSGEAVLCTFSPNWSVDPGTVVQFTIERPDFEATGGFLLEIADTENGPWSDVAEVTGFHHEMDGTGQARTVYFRFTPVSIFGRRNTIARWVRSISLTGDQSAPAIPSDVTVQGGSNRVKVSWTNPDATDFSHVEVFRSTTNDSGTSSLVGTFSGKPGDPNTFIDDQLASPQTYYYWLKSVDLSGNKSAFHAGANSGEEATTTSGFDTEAPATPTGLALVTSGTIANDGNFVAELQVDWDDNVEVDLQGYHVQHRLTGAGDWEDAPIQFAEVSSTVISPLKGNTSYDVRVRAFDSSNNYSDWTDPETQLTSSTPGAPAAPTGLTVTPFPLALLIEWDQNAEADILLYELERDDNDMFTSPVVVARLLAQHFVDNLPAQTTKWYRVRAIRRVGTPSNWSTAASGTTNGIAAPDLGPNFVGIEIVSGLPAPGTQGRLVFNTVDNRVYRDTGAGWVLEVPATDLTGLIEASGLADNAVTAAKILNGTITGVKIGDDQITAAKIAANQIGAAHIIAGAIVAGKLAANAVVAGNIAANAISAGTIQAAAIAASHIASNTINSTHLRTDTAVVTVAAQIANALINNAHIANLSVSTAKIQDLAVGTIKIGNNAVTNKGEDRTSSGVGVGTDTELASLTLSFSSGTNVLALFRCQLSFTDPGDEVFIELLRGATVIDSLTVGASGASNLGKGSVVLMDLDTPGSGSITYKVQATLTGTACTASERALVLTEYLK